METRAHHVLIGLFSVIVIGAALLFGLSFPRSPARRVRWVGWESLRWKP